MLHKAILFPRPALHSLARPTKERRTFLGLQRPPPPKPPMMGYLVVQGLAVVLLADLAIATALNQPTTIRSVVQTAGLWNDTPEFEPVKLDGGKEGAD